MGNNVSKIIELVIQIKNDTSKVLTAITSDLKTFERSVQASSKDTTALGKSTSSTSKKIKNLDGSVRTYTKDAVKGTAATKKYRASIKGLGDAASASGTKIKQSGKSARVSAGSFASLFGTIASLALPVVEFANFERAMAEVGAVANSSQSDLEAMTVVAEELGRTTEYTASQAAGGMKFLAMAGLEAADIMAAIPGVLNLAMAGNVDLATAADISTNILTGMGLAVSDLARVNNILVEGFTSTNSSLEELGTAMAYVAPVASGMGLSLEETTAALGLLHNAGIKGSMAGTTLRGVLTKLTKPTDDASEVMASLASSIGQSSLEIMDSEGNFLGMVKVMEQLEAAGMTTTEAMTIFGLRAGPGMIALLNQGSGAFTKLNDSLDDVGDRAQEVGDAMHDNLTGTFKDTLSALSGLAIALGEQLKPAIELVFDIVTKVASAVTGWVKDNEELASTLGTVAAAVGILFVALQSLNIAMGISSLLGAGLFTKLAVAIKALALKVGAYFLSGLSSMIAAAGGLGASMGTVLTTSFISALSGIGLALGAFFAGYSLGKLIEPWISEMELGGVRIKTHIQVLIASFDTFFIKLKYGFKAASNDAAFFFLDILNQAVTFAQDFSNLQRQIPGLGKLLGFAEEKSGITAALDFIKGKTTELQAVLDESYSTNVAGRTAELAAVQNLVDMIYAEELAVKKSAAAKKEAGKAAATDTTLKVSTELKGTDFSEARTAFRTNYEKLLAEIATDTKAAQATAAVAIAQLQLDAATGLISTQDLEAKVHKIRINSLEAEALAYTKLQTDVETYLGTTSRQHADLANTLNNITTDRIGLLTQQVISERQLAEEVKRARDQQMQLALQQATLDAEMTGDSDLARLVAKSKAEEAYYSKSIAMKKQELASLNALSTASQVDILGKENELNALIMESQASVNDNYKAVITERLRIAEEGYARGTLQADAYAAVVSEAWRAGILAEAEASEKTVEATGSMWENLNEGMATSLEGAQSMNAMLQDIGETAITAFADGMTASFSDFVAGTKSAKEAFSDFASSFLKMIADMIMKQMILNGLKAIGLGAASGGQIGGSFESGTQSYATGGRVRGSSPTPTADNIPAWLTAGEFVQPVSSVKHYGSAFMEAIRTRSLDIGSALQGFATGGLVGVPTGLRLADGGLVNSTSAPAVDVTTGDNHFTIANVIDKNLMGDYLDSVGGEKSMINFITNNQSVIKGILR